MRSNQNSPFGISNESAEKLWPARSYAEQVLAEEKIPIEAIYAQPELADNTEPLKTVREEYLSKEKEQKIFNRDACSNLQSRDPAVFFENFAILLKEWKSALIFEDYIQLQNDTLVPLLTEFIKNWDGAGEVGPGLNEILKYEGICIARELQYAVYDIIKSSDLRESHSFDENAKRRLDLAKAFYQRDNNIDRYCANSYGIDAIIPAFVRSQAEKEIPAVNAMVTIAETEEYRNLKILQELAIGNPKGDGGWSRIAHFVTFGTSTSLVGLINILPPHLQPVFGLIAFGVDAYSLKQMFPGKTSETKDPQESEEKLHTFPVRFAAVSALATLLSNSEIANGKKWIIEKTLLHMLKDSSLRVSERLQVANLIKTPLTGSGLSTLLKMFENSDPETQVVCGFALAHQRKEKIQSAVNRVTLANLPHMREPLVAIRKAQKNY